MSSHSLEVDRKIGGGWVADKRLIICICTKAHKAYFILRLHFYCAWTLHFKARPFAASSWSPNALFTSTGRLQRELQGIHALYISTQQKIKIMTENVFCARAFTRFHFAASSTLGVSASWIRPPSSYCILNDLHQATLNKLRKIRRQQMMSQPRRFIRDEEF